MPSSRCASCKRSRPVTFSTTRQGGGSYNRAPRSYRSTICDQCVLYTLSYVLSSRSTDGFSSTTIVYLAEQLVADNPDATATDWDHPERIERPASWFIEQYRERQAAQHAEYRARVAAAQRTQGAQGTA